MTESQASLRDFMADTTIDFLFSLNDQGIIDDIQLNNFLNQYYLYKQHNESTIT